MKIVDDKLNNLIKKLRLVFAMLILTIVFSACSSSTKLEECIEEGKEPTNADKVIDGNSEVKEIDLVSADVYLNNGVSLEQLAVSINKGNELEQILAYLQEGAVDKGLYKTIVDPRIIENLQLENKVLNVYLSSLYSDLGDIEQLLLRSSVVKSFTSLKEVEEIAFYLDKMPLKDSNNMPYANYSSDDVIYEGELMAELAYYEKVKLYYPNGDKLFLVVEEAKVGVNDELVNEIVNMLMSKSEKNPEPAIPTETMVISSYIADGVCFLNLSQDFLNNKSGDKEDNLAIYSIVNSLTELPDVSKVQFLIEGEKKDLLRGENYIYETFEFNYDIVGENIIK